MTITEIENRITEIIKVRATERESLEKQIEEQESRKASALKAQAEAEKIGDFAGYKSARADFHDSKDNISFYRNRINLIDRMGDIDHKEIEALTNELIKAQRMNNAEFIKTSAPVYEKFKAVVDDQRSKTDRVNRNLNKLSSYLGGTVGIAPDVAWQFSNMERFILNYENAKKYQPN